MIYRHTITGRIINSPVKLVGRYFELVEPEKEEKVEKVEEPVEKPKRKKKAKD